MENIDLSKIHDCEKCHGKIVGVTVDHVGVTRCSYCNEVVDYSSVTKQMVTEMIKHECKNHKV